MTTKNIDAFTCIRRPSSKGRFNVLEDLAIPLFPKAPACYDYYLSKTYGPLKDFLASIRV
jgi:hypothetical protein